MSETQAPLYGAIGKAADEFLRIAENGVENGEAVLAKRIAELDVRLLQQANQIELMLRQLDVESELVAGLTKRLSVRSQAAAQSEAEPEEYIRIQITKNTRGYSYETSVSLRDRTIEPERLRDLLFVADAEARDEISRREALDREPVGE
jgi:capsule polysaccharide export protein KpsE/RkpR